MSIITRYLGAVTEPEFKLARDLTAMALADGEVTPEEMEAMKVICHLEGIDESRLIEALRDGSENENMPDSQPEKKMYLKKLIKLIGADGYSAPQEVYLFQIIASKMGLNQMDVIGLFLSAATYDYFAGDAGSKTLSSFLKNYIDPKAKTENDNRENLRAIYDTVASHTETSPDEDVDRETLQKNLARATKTFMENKILVREFADVGLDFSTMAREEAQRVFERYTSY